MTRARHLTARDATRELGIRLPTLYAYVSRGLIRSEETGGDKRERRYLAEDVLRLKERKEQRRHPGKLVETALHWGTPILESSITLITADGLFFRGADALLLATTRTFEEVAALIWNVDQKAAVTSGRTVRTKGFFSRCRHLSRQVDDLTPVEKFQCVLPVAVADDVLAFDTRPSSVALTGMGILRLFTSLASGIWTFDDGIADTLRRGWAPHDPKASALINAALILCADHELNASSFTARCVASTGSTPYHVVAGGLAALQGNKHGGSCNRVDALIQECRRMSDVPQVIAKRMRLGESIPGFGHPLYPNGDPRGRKLLELTEAAYPRSRAVLMARSLEQKMSNAMDDHPNVDLALVTLCNAIKAPKGGALALFALGRTVGWIGHAIEQYQIDRLIRPRSRYVGHLPVGSQTAS